MTARRIPGKRVAIAALFLLGAPGGSSAIPTLQYLTKLSGDPALGRPTAVTFDPVTGSLCVTDEESRTINVFDDRGLHRFRSDAISRISSPRDASLDAEGGFYFIDAGTEQGRVPRRLNFLGEPVEFEPELPHPGWSPQHFTLLRDGDFLTLDRAGLLVKHRAADGSVAWKLALAEPDWERADLLGRPVEAPDGRIYIANPGAGRIIVLSPDGKSRKGFGLPGSKRGEMAFPVAVTFGSRGEVLVLDRIRHTILIFDAGHVFRNEHGHVGYQPGDLYHPLAMVCTPDDLLYVSQGLEGRIQVFRLLDTSDHAGESPLPSKN